MLRRNRRSAATLRRVHRGGNRVPLYVELRCANGSHDGTDHLRGGSVRPRHGCAVRCAPEGARLRTIASVQHAHLKVRGDVRSLRRSNCISRAHLDGAATARTHGVHGIGGCARSAPSGSHTGRSTTLLSAATAGRLGAATSVPSAETPAARITPGVGAPSRSDNRTRIS